MSKSGRTRVEWTPSPVGAEVLQISARLFPYLSQPARIEKLMVTGLAALQHPPWRPPELCGTDRMAWTLPLGLHK